MALEFYIRLGLGQFSEIATRMNLLQGNRLTPEKLNKIYKLCEEMEEILWGDEEKPWDLKDDEISIFTLNAFLLESQIGGSKKSVNWVKNRLKELYDS